MKRSLVIFMVILLTFPIATTRANENPFIQNRFNPDISLIGDFAFISSDIRDEAREKLEIPKFLHHMPHSHMNKDRGIHFNYLEIALSAPVDPYFDFMVVSTISPEHGLELEEVYSDLRFLPYGFGARLGFFKSNVGRHNSRHAHNWDFYDSPIVYDTMLGSEGLSDIGLRLTYTFPLSFFLQLGAEVFQGSSEEAISFNADGFHFLDKEVEEARKPSLYTGYLKTSFDFGDHIFLLGSSILYGNSNLIHSEQHSHHHTDSEEEKGNQADHAISAEGTIIYGFDFAYKYILDSYRYLSIEGEYLGRKMKGDLFKINNNGTEDESDDTAIVKNLDRFNSGAYAQMLFKFNKRLRTGLRVDYLFEPDIKIDGNPPVTNEFEKERFYKVSYMIEYYFTEFSRLRFQYNYDHTKYYDESMFPIQEFIFSFNVAAGAHGAHSF